MDRHAYGENVKWLFNYESRQSDVILPFQNPLLQVFGLLHQ